MNKKILAMGLGLGLIGMTNQEPGLTQGMMDTYNAEIQKCGQIVKDADLYELAESLKQGNYQSGDVWKQNHNCACDARDNLVRSYMTANPSAGQVTWQDLEETMLYRNVETTLEESDTLLSRLEVLRGEIRESLDKLGDIR